MSAGKHWEYRVFGRLPAKIRTTIEQFDKEFGKEDKGHRTTDEYLWQSSCKANIKIRDDSLKFKTFIKQVEDGFELWLEDPAENFQFPLESAAIDLLESSLNIRVPPELQNGCDSLFRLKSALASCKPPIQLIAIEKHRIQYIYPDAESEVLVEVANVFCPVELESISIEGHDLSTNDNIQENLTLLRSIRDALELPGQLRVMGYVELLEEWTIKRKRPTFSTGAM